MYNWLYLLQQEVKTSAGLGKYWIFPIEKTIEKWSDLGNRLKTSNSQEKVFTKLFMDCEKMEKNENKRNDKKNRNKSKN